MVFLEQTGVVLLRGSTLLSLLEQFVSDCVDLVLLLFTLNRIDGLLLLLLVHNDSRLRGLLSHRAVGNVDRTSVSRVQPLHETRGLKPTQAAEVASDGGGGSAGIANDEVALGVLASHGQAVGRDAVLAAEVGAEVAVILLRRHDVLLGDLRGTTLGIGAGIHEHDARLARLLHNVLKKALSQVSGAQEVGLEGELVACVGLAVLGHKADAGVVHQHIKVDLLLLDLLHASVDGVRIRHVHQEVLRVRRRTRTDRNGLVLRLLLQLRDGVLRSRLASAADNHLGSGEKENLGSKIAKTGVSSLHMTRLQGHAR